MCSNYYDLFFTFDSTQNPKTKAAFFSHSLRSISIKLCFYIVYYTSYANLIILLISLIISNGPKKFSCLMNRKYKWN